MEILSDIYFKIDKVTNLKLLIYNQLGSSIEEISYKTVIGKNKITLKKGSLSTGLYFCKLTGASQDYKVLKLIVN